MVVRVIVCNLVYNILAINRDSLERKEKKGLERMVADTYNVIIWLKRNLRIFRRVSAIISEVTKTCREESKMKVGA